MGVALLADTTNVITAVTGVGTLGCEHTLLQSDKALHQLEGRAWRILGRYGTVEQRLALVAQHLHIVVASVAANQLVGIVAWR